MVAKKNFPWIAGFLEVRLDVVDDNQDGYNPNLQFNYMVPSHDGQRKEGTVELWNTLADEGSTCPSTLRGWSMACYVSRLRQYMSCREREREEGREEGSIQDWCARMAVRRKGWIQKPVSVLRVVFNGSPDTFILSLASRVSARQGPRELTAWRGASPVEAGHVYDGLSADSAKHRASRQLGALGPVATWFRCPVEPVRVGCLAVSEGSDASPPLKPITHPSTHPIYTFLLSTPTPPPDRGALRLPPSTLLSSLRRRPEQTQPRGGKSRQPASLPLPPTVSSTLNTAASSSRAKQHHPPTHTHHCTPL
ncbi:hypothetical protein KC359_g213 [Hortaea werneckii]|nr:hypothetical protein KC359_g213 [Hortaea werneckii]